LIHLFIEIFYSFFGDKNRATKNSDRMETADLLDLKFIFLKTRDFQLFFEVLYF